eukprot:scaffold1570_cov61-Phaeocystis_antarctica.AAC.5
MSRNLVASTHPRPAVSNPGMPAASFRRACTFAAGDLSIAGAAGIVGDLVGLEAALQVQERGGGGPRVARRRPGAPHTQKQGQCVCTPDAPSLQPSRRAVLPPCFRVFCTAAAHISGHLSGILQPRIVVALFSRSRNSLRSPPMPMLLALLTTLIAAKGPGRPTVDIICVEGEQAAGDPTKMNTATALLGAIGCTDPDAIAYR